MKSDLSIATWSLVGLTLFQAGFAPGQQTAPKDYRGVEEEVLAAIDLAKEKTASMTVRYGSAVSRWRRAGISASTVTRATRQSSMFSAARSPTTRSGIY